MKKCQWINMKYKKSLDVDKGFSVLAVYNNIYSFLY